MATATLPTLKHLLRDYGLKVWDNKLAGEWYDPKYEAAIKHELLATKVDLNDHLDEIISGFVQRDIADRAKRPVFVENEKGFGSRLCSLRNWPARA
jgi:hypothetical protein